MEKIKTWIVNNKVEFVVLLLIVAVGAFVRLFKIDQYMTFLGDEGRDVIIVRRLLTEGHPPLIGPGTSIGSMYLGPLYYYMMAPALLLANFSPVGPAVQIALLGIATIVLVWFAGREWFGKVAATVAALLYSISPTVIIYSRSSWNPNIMPFFALLLIYSVYRFWRKQEFKWIIVTGVAFAFTLQSHYLGLLLAPTIGVFWLLTLWKTVKDKNKKVIKSLLTKSLISAGLFLLLMSPLAIFDVRHGYINFNAIMTFFVKRETTVSIIPWKAIPNMWPIYGDVVTRLPGGRDVTAGMILSYALVIFIVWTLIRLKKLNPEYKFNFLLVLTWLLFGLVGLGLYKQHIYDHYYGFFFPAPFLLTGMAIAEISKSRKRIFVGLSVILVGALVYANSIQNPLKYPPTMQLTRAQVVSKRVVEVASGQRFNFSLIADANYDPGYRYFLNLMGAKVVDIDPQNADATITDQLLVVCEKPKEKCDPTHNPKAEIAGFGWTKVESDESVFGVTLYKLVHTK